MIEFTHEIEFSELSMEDFDVTIESDPRKGEFTEPLTFFIPPYNYWNQPTYLLTLEVEIPEFDKNDGPQIRVWYKNTDKLADVYGNKLRNFTWGFTNLNRMDDGYSPYKYRTMRGLGITSNLFLITSMALVTITNAFTAKSIMPAVTIFFSF